eukprot:357415-Chlamydomonas_euryale.AAC.11
MATYYVPSWHTLHASLSPPPQPSMRTRQQRAGRECVLTARADAFHAEDCSSIPASHFTASCFLRCSHCSGCTFRRFPAILGLLELLHLHEQSVAGLANCRPATQSFPSIPVIRRGQRPPPPRPRRGEQESRGYRSNADVAERGNVRGD